MIDKPKCRKKNRIEVSAYKRGVRAMRGYENTNTEEPFQNLRGSNEDYYRPLSKEKEEKPVGAKRQKLINFIKNHVFEEIVTVVITIILTIGGWCISNIIDLNKQVAVFEYRIDVAETKLSEFDNDTVTKEYLSQELQILKLQLEKANSDDLSEIEGQIKLIEKQIEYLSKNQSSNKTPNNKDGNT